MKKIKLLIILIINLVLITPAVALDRGEAGLLGVGLNALLEFAEGRNGIAENRAAQNYKWEARQKAQLAKMEKQKDVTNKSKQ